MLSRLQAYHMFDLRTTLDDFSDAARALVSRHHQNLFGP